MGVGVAALKSRGSSFGRLSPGRIALLSLVVVFVCGGACWAPQRQTDVTEEEYNHERLQMVSQQLQSRDIRSPRVLEVMSRVPRHLFVPESSRRSAYEDYPLPIGEGQTISQPYIVALMTQLLDPMPHHKALEVGTGSGYQAAVLGELVDQVYTIEIVRALGERARTTLDELGYSNVHVRVGDGYDGWPEEAPFDLIIITAAAPEIPQPLLDQLGDNGRLVMPVGMVHGVQTLVMVTRREGRLERHRITGVRFVPLTGKAQNTP